MTDEKVSPYNFDSQLVAERVELGVTFRIYENRIFHVSIPKDMKIGKSVIDCGYSFLDENGETVENRNSIHNHKWKKLDDGMIQELRYNLAGDEVVMNPFCPFYELRFSYDENGYLVRMANYEEDTLYNCTEENCGDIGVSYFFAFADIKKIDLFFFLRKPIKSHLQDLQL